MKFVKYLIALIAVVAIAPALLPSQYEIARTITIDDSQESVFSYLVNLESWAEWSPWLALEPDAKHTFHGIPGVVGSYTEWKGEKIGAGRQTLMNLKQSDYLETKLEFFEPSSSEAIGFMEISPKGEGVEVKWGMKGDLSYPIERVFGLFMNSMMGEHFEKGLQSLKKKLETSKVMDQE